MMSPSPLFSIIIPTFNRPEGLRRCLQALAAQNFSAQRFEVILVDDGGSVDLTPLVAPFQERLSITVIRQKNAGPAAARNAGSVHARGQFLIFTDDDCAPTKNWLTIFAEQCQKTPDRLIGGFTVNALKKNAFAEVSQQLITFLYAHFNRDAENPRFFTSNNMLIPAARFREIGGFDTTFPLAAGEDRAFCAHWLNNGWKMIYAPDAVVFHAHQMSLTGFLRQHFNYGRGAFRFHQLQLKTDSSKNRRESPAFYINLIFYPLSKSKSARAVLRTGLMFISQIATTAGYLWEMLNKNSSF